MTANDRERLLYFPSRKRYGRFAYRRRAGCLPALEDMVAAAAITACLLAFVVLYDPHSQVMALCFGVLVVFLVVYLVRHYRRTL